MVVLCQLQASGIMCTEGIGRHSRPICPPTVGRYIGRYVGRHIGRYSDDMLFEFTDRRSTLSVGMSVGTRPTPRPICRVRLPVMYRSTVGGIVILLMPRRVVKYHGLEMKKPSHVAEREHSHTNFLRHFFAPLK